MKSLSRLLSVDRIQWLDDATKDACLQTMVSTIARSAQLGEEESIYEAILEREKLLSTGFTLGLAIPHAKLSTIKDFVVGLGLHKRGVAFDSLDEKPVHILVMILGPDQRQDEYLKVLSRVTTFLKENREKLLSLDDAEAVYQLTLDY